MITDISIFLKKNWFKIGFLLALLLRLILIIIAPPTLFTDGIDNYIPSAFKLLELDLSFWYPPLYIAIIAPFLGLLPFITATFFIKLLNLLFFMGWAYFSHKFLRLIGISDKASKIAILITSFTSWSLLMSASIHNDMLFAILFSISLCVVYSFKPDTKSFIKLALIIWLMLMTKPTGFLVLPSLCLLFLYKNWFKIKHIMIFGLSTMIGIAGYIPWFAKNGSVQDVNVGTNDLSQSIRLKFIGFDRFLPQLRQSFEYFWEFASLDKLSTLGSVPSWLLTAFYLSNVIIFGILTVLLAISLVENLKKDKKTALTIIISSLSILTFGTIYMIYFDLYNSVDPGRYFIPVMVFAILSFVIARFKKIYYLVIVCAIGLSIINSSVMIAKYRLDYNKTTDVIEFIADKGVSKSYTNDKLTSIILRFYNFESNQDDSINQPFTDCQDAFSNNIFSVCIEDDSAYIFKAFISRE